MATKEKKKIFLNLELPDYEYKSGLACPECYAPIERGRVDGRCDSCLKSKVVLPINYLRPPKKKDEDEQEQ